MAQETSMNAKAVKRNKILNAVHEAARDLYSAGFIDARQMREYDALCMPPLPESIDARIAPARTDKRARGKS